MSTALRVLRQLIQPLYFAAYVTWLAVLLVLLDTPADSFLNGERGTALAIMVIFLAAFVVKGLLTPGRPHWSDYPLLAVEGLAVLALCVVWPRNMAPVLTIVFIADCAMLLSAPALIAVGIALNVALWIIVAMSWNMSQPSLFLLAYIGFQLFAALTAWYARRAEKTANDLQADQRPPARHAFAARRERARSRAIAARA